MDENKVYPDDDFSDKLYQRIFGGKLNKDIFKKTEEPKKENKRIRRIKD